LSWLFNVGWNPVFFYAQAIEWALAEITLLFVIILLLARLSFGLPSSNRGRWGIVPYLLWLCVAISLNAYPVFVR
jgi:tryptophan-rich sensory protein